MPQITGIPLTNGKSAVEVTALGTKQTTRTPQYNWAIVTGAPKNGR